MAYASARVPTMETSRVCLASSPQSADTLQPETTSDDNLGRLASAPHRHRFRRRGVPTVGYGKHHGRAHATRSRV